MAVVLVVGMLSLNGKHRAVVLVAGGLSEVVLVPNIVSSSQHRTEPLNGNLCSTSCSSIRCLFFSAGSYISFSFRHSSKVPSGMVCVYLAARSL